MRVLFVSLLLLSGCATNTPYPEEWARTVSAQAVSPIYGTYANSCQYRHGKHSGWIDLAQIFGGIKDKRFIANSVTIEPKGIKLKITFNAPFDEKTELVTRYSMKEGWVTLKDYDVKFDGESGGGIPLFWTKGKRQKLRFRQSKEGDLIIVGSERSDLFFVLVSPYEKDWIARCKSEEDEQEENKPEANTPAPQPEDGKASLKEA